MGRKERIPITASARVSLRGRPHMGSGVVVRLSAAGVWAHMNWDRAIVSRTTMIRTPFARIHHVDELEVALGEAPCSSS
jgi:hypothetical protein